MKNKVILVYFLFFCLCGCAHGGWKKFVYRDAGFRVSAPEEPERNYMEIEAGTVSLTVQMYSYYRGPSVQFHVYEALFPESIPDLPPLIFSDGMINQLIERQPDAPVNKKSISLGGYPGVEAKVEIPRGYIKLRLYLAGRRLYLVYALVLEEQASLEEAERFINSFQFSHRD